MFANDTVAQALLTRLNVTAPHENVGTVIHRTKNMIKCTFDFAVYTGAVGTYNLLDELGNPAILPKNAYVTNVVAVVQTAMTSAASGTLQLNLLSSADLMAAKLSAALTLAAVVAGVPVGTAATWVGPVVTATGTQLAAQVVTGAITAGKVQWFVEYVILT